MGGGASFHSHILPLEKSYESETGHKIEYTNPDATRISCRWLVGFVDDNSIMLKLENLGYEASVERLLDAAKNFLEIWQRLVHISGGELELTKSSYSLMTWKHKDGKEKLCTINMLRVISAYGLKNIGA